MFKSENGGRVIPELCALNNSFITDIKDPIK